MTKSKMWKYKKKQNYSCVRNSGTIFPGTLRPTRVSVRARLEATCGLWRQTHREEFRNREVLTIPSERKQPPGEESGRQGGPGDE